MLSAALWPVSPTTTSARPASASVSWALELKPVEPIGPKREKIRQLTNRRELRVTEHFYRYQTGEVAEIKLCRLHGTRQVGDTENHVVFVSSDIGQHLRIRGREELERPAAEDLEEFAEANHVPHPVQQRRRVGLLGFDVHRGVAVDRIHDQRTVQPLRIGAGEAA